MVRMEDMSVLKDISKHNHSILKKVNYDQGKALDEGMDLLADRSWIEDYEQGFYKGLMGVINSKNNFR